MHRSYITKAAAEIADYTNSNDDTGSDDGDSSACDNEYDDDYDGLADGRTSEGNGCKESGGIALISIGKQALTISSLKN